MKTALIIKKNVKAGFSLVEMLVVIAVIGIMAAIAIPMIGNMTTKATTGKNQRNAQNICSVWSAAIANGYAPTATTAQDIVDVLQTGFTAGGVQFKVDVSDGEETGALGFISPTVTSSLLTYVSAGGQDHS